jgi:hypothetical protein
MANIPIRRLRADIEAIVSNRFNDQTPGNSFQEKDNAPPYKYRGVLIARSAPTDRRLLAPVEWERLKEEERTLLLENVNPFLLGAALARIDAQRVRIETEWHYLLIHPAERS